MGIITQVLLPAILAFIMFSMGLSLVAADFKRVAAQPKAFAVGAVSQIILLPLIAFGIVSLWPISPALAVGVMILAACPGGVTSNLLTHLAKGDTALSISLTAIISVLGVFTIPFIVNFSLAHFMGATEASALPIGQTIFGIFMITTVPVFIGMAINHFKPKFAARFEVHARRIATVLFVLIVLGAVLKDRAHLAEYFAQAGPVTLCLNLVMMIAAVQIARVFKLPKGQQVAISLECGLQNGTLAIMIAATFLGNLTMGMPAAIYSLLMFATAAGLILWARRPEKKPRLRSTENGAFEVTSSP